MEPTKKAKDIENFLENVYSRTSSIKSNRCIPPPIGCGKEVTLKSFRDELSIREYKISGLCQQCQDEIFGNGR